MATETCTTCGEAAHASETDDLGNCAKCLTAKKLEDAWLCVISYPDGSDNQVICCHELVCHGDGASEHPQAHEDGDTGCAAPVDREALKMLDLARIVRDDDGDELELRKRWYAGRPS